MRLRSKVLVAAAALITAAGIAAVWMGWRESAPEVAFTTLDGERLSMADLKGKTVLVNFWATSCVTCVKEMPLLAATQRKFESRGYVTVAVAMSYDPPAHVAAFVRKNGLPFKVVLDTDGDIARRFGNVFVTPTSFLLSKRGEIAKHFVGEPNPDWLHSAIEAEIGR